MFDLTDTFLKIWALDAVTVIGKAGIICMAISITIGIAIFLTNIMAGDKQPTKFLYLCGIVCFIGLFITIIIPSEKTIGYLKIVIITNDTTAMTLNTEVGKEAHASLLYILKELRSNIEPQVVGQNKLMLGLGVGEV